MSDESIIPEDNDDVLAAELSLGLLSGDALTHAQRRARTDLRFASLVEDWDIHFSTLTETIEPVTPPKGLFHKITQQAYPESSIRIWHHLGILPAFLGAGAAALVLILALQFGNYMQPETPVASLVAEMVAEDESIVVAAAYVDNSNTLFVEWQVGERLPDRDVELWLVSEGEAISLGVLSKEGKITEFSVPAELQDLLADGALAVTDEPIGGSPTGVATGAVLAVGPITTL
ncbi:Anti-sigma-K factor RskA [Octadecabacter temperatus]|uniref:Anti-sigma-K factor rskA n=1 Tax=Octadecabacter temperatus TaxID=1458307 RepID=A0A0K0Y3Y7_9RHOB|nr:anti-sigma factor [Octadecabacter temperatus]AKS45683.1 Anti-sigma-K factor rskA [Octadecabacter temperatus]SIN98279.1 Anti-sigma-K factor RskA [Octadecabacter temperatus]